MKNIYLYGPPASGKTTLGRLLADRLNATFVDLDERIVQTAGRTIPEIFSKEGESGFRALETQVLRGNLGPHPSSGRIIALGGGTLLDVDNRTFCEENGLILCLEAPSSAELARRIAADGAIRPLGNRAEERAAHYASFSNRIAAFSEVGPSLVIVGNGFAPELLRGRRFVADAKVNRLFGEALGAPVAVIPSGESNKTPATICALWSAFAAAGLGRRDVVAAVGGGVTGDLTGFAAATWMRGIDWINVPTTLLSMVDASTGGKTGCDLPEGKNLAGTFHPPRLVLIDTDFLRTLSPELVAAGRAEMIKHEVIGGRMVDAGVGVPTAAELACNLMVKLGIVREDPFECLGRRLLLNCGHTVAHAVETLTNYRLAHGEAVSIGCVEEARLAVRMGLAAPTWPDELAVRFAATGLPTKLPDGLDWNRLRPVMVQDKKRDGLTVTFALPCGWGDVRAVPIDLSEGGSK